MSKRFSLRVEDEIALVAINVFDQPMNVWSAEALADYDGLFEELGDTSRLRGIVFHSTKADNFLVGADLSLIAGMESPEDVLAVIGRFHGVVRKLGTLACPSVAAIHGHCLGGGLEFALGFTARIAREEKTTIGLPECGLGLFPGGGGTQRLPRLIGYPAIDLVLKAAPVDARQAYELGIVDRLVPPGGDLLGEAKAFLAEIIDGRAELRRPVQDFSRLDEAVERARQETLKASRGREIPGPMLALDAISRGVKTSLARGLEIEQENFVTAALSREAKGNINTFFLKTLTDKPKALMTKGFTARPIQCAAVLGFGTMGRGIVIDVLRNTSVPVLVKDVSEALEPGKAFVRKILEGMAEKKRLKEPVESVLARLTFVTEYTPDFQKADIVIEAVFEDIQVKQEVYEELSKVIRDDCLVASNTSFLPITTMAKFISRPERFGGTHFFSPVWMMQLLEIIRGEETSQDTVDNLLHFSALIRKRPILCNDNPGFVVNALLFPYLRFAYECVEEGNAIENVDRALVKFGMPVGPIRLTDEAGIDVLQKVFSANGVEQQTLNNLVADGRLGLKKSGKGFFLRDGSVDPAVLPLVGKRQTAARTEEELQNGVMEAMARVGKDLLDRKVVADVRMIDTGCIWGAGFPADKGGPMKWADLTGLSRSLFGKNFYS
ncbi:MAG: enoyl-CoA hydratase/isomerase family protein [Deltaproteobacteria bacterium]|nr:enoyl-CoA hydratase/isomerase family protein [Deltaproteobacteria bacterium]